MPRACGIPGVAGDPDCVGGSATCTVGPLAEGTYTLRHGDAQTTFTLPSAGSASPCAGL